MSSSPPPTPTVRSGGGSALAQGEEHRGGGTALGQAASRPGGGGRSADSSAAASAVAGATGAGLSAESIARHGIPAGVLAGLLGARLVGRADVVLKGIDSLDAAGEGQATFIRSAKHAGRWAGSRASAALVSEGIEVPGHDAATRALLFVPDADMALVKILGLIAPKNDYPAGVHASSVIERGASVAASAHVGPLCVVGTGSVVGERAVLTASVTLGRGVKIGDDTVLQAGVVVLDRSEVGRRCNLHPGVKIGADGFGFIPSPGGGGGGVLKVPHVGNVEIGDDVEIGSNSCVDRGKFGPTVIGDGTKIDNLVQIGHNCRIGKNVLICAMGGIGGSTTIGDGTVIGGHVGVADNTKIGAGAKIAAKAGVMTDVPGGETWGGLPAQPHRNFLRTWAYLRRVGREHGERGDAHESGPKPERD